MGMAGKGGSLTLAGTDMGGEEGNKKSKTPPAISESFPTDETPTPTRILKMADMDLFGELKDSSGQYSGKENPFDAHFRKAAEAVKQGADSLSATVTATELVDSEESLNTPQIYCTEASHTQPSCSTVSTVTTATSISTAQPVILKVQPNNVKTFKPIAPSPLTLPPSSCPSSSALLLLKFPSGETVKLSNLPLAPPPQQQMQPPIHVETKTRLKQTLNVAKAQRLSNSSTTKNKKEESRGVSEEEKRRRKEEIEEESERKEQKERNRMSAQRSRQRKRVQSDSLRQESNKVRQENGRLREENVALREEVEELKALLALHQNCGNIGNEDKSHGTTTPFMLNSLKSPPQTVPEDLRVQRTPGLSEACSDAGGAGLEGNVPAQLHIQLPIPSPSNVCYAIPAVAPSLAPQNAKSFTPQHPNSILPIQNQVPAMISGMEPVKQTLARHCHKTTSRRVEEVENRGVLRGRLKDKLHDLKRKLAEDS